MNDEIRTMKRVGVLRRSLGCSSLPAGDCRTTLDGERPIGAGTRPPPFARTASLERPRIAFRLRAELVELLGADRRDAHRPGRAGAPAPGWPGGAQWQDVSRHRLRVGAALAVGAAARGDAGAGGR